MYKNWWTKHNFNRFFFPLKFIQKIHNYEIILDEAIKDQEELGILITTIIQEVQKKQKRKLEYKPYMKKINKKQNVKLVNVIKSGLINLKNHIKQMSEDEKKNWKTR